MWNAQVQARENTRKTDDELHALRAQDLAEECVEYPALWPRGCSELDDDEHAKDGGRHEGAGRSTGGKAGDLEQAELCLVLVRGALCREEVQGCKMRNLDLTEDATVTLPSAENTKSQATCKQHEEKSLRHATKIAIRARATFSISSH